MLDFVYDFFGKGLNLAEQDYNEYYDHLTEITEGKRERIKIDIYSKEGGLKAIEGEITDRALSVARSNMSDTTNKVN